MKKIELKNELDECIRIEKKLHKSELNRQYFIDNVSDGIFCFEMPIPIDLSLPIEEKLSISFKSICIECNNAFALQHNTSPEDLIGHKLAYFMPPIEINQFHLTNFFNHNCRIDNIENRQVDAQGNERWLLNSIFGEIVEGKLIRVWGRHRDITEQKKAERALRESEDRYKAVVSNLPDIILIHRNGKIVFVNNAGYKITGYVENEVLGKTIFEFVDEKYRDLVIGSFNRMMQSEKIEEYDIEIICKNNERRMFTTRVIPISYVNDPALLVVLSDITERKKAEQTVNLLAHSIKNISECITITDMDDKIIFVNNAFLKTYGYEEHELRGKHIGIVRSPGNLPELVAPIHDATLGSGWHGELLNRKKDGTEFPIFLSTSVVRDEKGIPIALVGVTVDLTESKRMGEELLKIKKIESLGTFAGGIAHDFNNILTSILGNISLARYNIDKDIEKSKGILKNAKKAAIKAKDLTLQLLTFSKGGTPVKKPGPINDLLKDSISFALRGSKALCEYFFQDDLWSVEIDEGQISQVLQNLVINADQAMPQGGVISIKAENVNLEVYSTIPLPPGKYIKISIKDHGIGIPSEQLSKIFDPYFTTKEKGSGLGLAIAYSIIRKHNGHITVKSEPGVGSTFSFFLPAFDSILTFNKSNESNLLTGKGRVLVMDDDEMIREFVVDLLTNLGYEVELAGDGDEAIQLYLKAKENDTPFDAVIMDLTIPGGMGGDKAIIKLKEIDPNVKAIVSSGYSNDPIMSNYKMYGFSAVISKPYEVNDLSKTLYELINGTL